MLSTDFEGKEIGPDIKMLLDETIAEWNERSKKGYRLELSIGTVCGSYSDEIELKKLISEADKKIYRVKAVRKSVGSAN